MKCQAHRKNGEVCKNNAVTGKRVCRMHGGATPGGIAAGSYKTGRYSKYLPTRLLSQYKASMSDGRVLSMRDDIAVVDARLAELMQRLDTKETGQAWQAVRDAAALLVDGLRTQTAAMINQGVRDLRTAIDTGGADSELWAELHQTIDQRRKLVESERRLMVELQQMLTIEDATLMINAVADSIKRNVTDAATLRAIQTDLNTILVGRPDNPIDATSTTIDASFD